MRVGEALRGESSPFQENSSDRRSVLFLVETTANQTASSSVRLLVRILLSPPSSLSPRQPSPLVRIFVSAPSSPYLSQSAVQSVSLSAQTSSPSLRQPSLLAGLFATAETAFGIVLMFAYPFFLLLPL